jgi:SAF domain
MTMAVLTRSRRTAGHQSPGQVPRRPRRRSVPLAAGGVVLVVVCALVFAEGWLQAGHRQPVLALAQPVTAGQVITSADLETVRVSAAGPVSLVPASRQAEVAGSTAAVSMPAGTLLTGADIGTPPPLKGQVRLGVALKPGQYPPDLAAGQDVDVLATPASGTTGSSSGSGSAGAALPVGQAVVLSVSASSAASSSGDTVVELQVPSDAMPQVAAASAAGQIALATIPAGG